MTLREIAELDEEINEVWESGFEQKVRADNLTDEIMAKEANARRAIFKAGEQAGIKEAVEWIDRHWFYSSLGDIYLHGEDWQAFKKSKGIGEEK